ncbi:putative secreted protein (Por secretion system target) [Mariniflexile fucanivorans]|uniref:Putative secreted protein (Por secretion system target) n=1 Tax=Mariniflexile fucanivorans TaxID=264023 RepID=A0A4R1RP16_9FLAO|nr:T9SS type A sorting domain-containing protein [Mariniflexile fucanivorans]TCL68073.1 putative secreted protein (Por secretion system target) [Mariniflexile fucanivorans]
MKSIIQFLIFTVCQFSIGQQGLYISSEGFLQNDNAVISVVNGDFVNSSKTALNGGTLQMIGLDGNSHRIELNNENTFDYLELYGSSSFELDGQLMVNREVFMNDTSSFIMNTGSSIIIGSTAEIVGESNTNTITGADDTYIKTTRNHTAGINNDFGLIGVVTYKGSTSMGSTEVFRRYGTFDISGNPTVKRYYEINPTINSGLDIEAHFYLSDIDLNGIQRSNLAAYRSTDNGLTFTKEGGTTETFYHSVSNIEAFSIWTFADASTLNIDEYDANPISIFPNPASHSITMYTNKNQAITSVELYDVTGKNMIMKPLSNKNTLNVSHLSNGIYLLKILSETTSITKKLVVKK